MRISHSTWQQILEQSRQPLIVMYTQSFRAPANVTAEQSYIVVIDSLGRARASTPLRLLPIEELYARHCGSVGSCIAVVCIYTAISSVAESVFPFDWQPTVQYVHIGDRLSPHDHFRCRRQSRDQLNRSRATPVCTALRLKNRHRFRVAVAACVGMVLLVWSKTMRQNQTRQQQHAANERREGVEEVHGRRLRLRLVMKNDERPVIFIMWGNDSRLQVAVCLELFISCNMRVVALLRFTFRFLQDDISIPECERSRSNCASKS